MLFGESHKQANDFLDYAVYFAHNRTKVKSIRTIKTFKNNGGKILIN